MYPRLGYMERKAIRHSSPYAAPLCSAAPINRRLCLPVPADQAPLPHSQTNNSYTAILIDHELLLLQIKKEKFSQTEMIWRLSDCLPDLLSESRHFFHIAKSITKVFFQIRKGKFSQVKRWSDFRGGRQHSPSDWAFWLCLIHRIMSSHGG